MSFSWTGSTLDRRFQEFHANNPDVYRQLVKMACDLRERGHKKLGIGMLFEVLRWQHYMSTEDPESEFKLNNSLRSRYARLLMHNEPALAGFFETRELSDSQIFVESDDEADPTED